MLRVQKKIPDNHQGEDGSDVRRYTAGYLQSRTDSRQCDWGTK